MSERIRKLSASQGTIDIFLLVKLDSFLPKNYNYISGESVLFTYYSIGRRESYP